MNLGKWITDTYKRKGDFAAKIGADPTLISRWMRGAGISEEYQAKIRKLGYKGPWPAEEAQEARQPSPAAGVSRDDLVGLEREVKLLRDDLEKEKKLRFALMGAVRQLAKASGLHQILEQLE